MEFVTSNYKAASGQTSGFFKAGQNADILLSGIDFNNTGGPLLFNHPTAAASDGTRLVLTDTFNNRVLIWNTLPQGNIPPDLVLGQKDFITNNPGTGRDQMNWPRGVAIHGRRLIVADSRNSRILIWTSFPTKSGAPADLVLQSGTPGTPYSLASKSIFFEPEDVWTDGQRLVVAFGEGALLIWNQFPTRDNQPADLRLTAGGKLNDPLHVISNGRSLMVDEHVKKGLFVWKNFPTKDEQPFDFFLPGHLWIPGDITSDGKLVLLNQTLDIWNALPETADRKPDLSIAIPSTIVKQGPYGRSIRPGEPDIHCVW